MLKILGALVVILTCAAMGVDSARRLRGGVRSLSALISALEMMKNEICERLTPMPELLELLELCAEHPADCFFAACRRALSDGRAATLSESWQLALAETKELLLTPDEALCLGELGKTLGRYDAESQGEAISHTQSRLTEYLRRAEGERAQKGKVCAALGLSAGLMLVILLV